MADGRAKNGGKRAGAGRPIGATSARKREIQAIVEKVETGYITIENHPKQVMLTVMQKALDEADRLEAEEGESPWGMLKIAHDAARDVAPYMHPKLSAIAVKADQEAGDAVSELFARISNRSKAGPK